MSLEYLTDAEVKIFCKPQELPLDENDELNQVQIDATIPFPRYEIQKVLKSAGYIVPLTTQEEVDLLKYITIPVFKYHITSNNGTRTDQINTDYATAKRELQNIQAGKIILDLPTVNDPDGDTGSGVGGIHIVTLDIW